ETPELDLKNLLKKLNNLEKSQVIKEVAQDHNKQKSLPRFQEELESEFNEYEINVIYEALSRGFNVWKITVSLSPDCLIKSVRAFMVFRNLESLGEIIKAVPPVQDIEDEKFDREFSLFLVSKEEPTEIERALNISEIKIKSMEKVKVKKAKESTPRKSIKTKNKTQFASGKKPQIHQTVRVDIERLDKLMNLVGELVINKTRLEQIYLSNDWRGLHETIEQINRITTDLQMIVQNVRMVSIEQVFNRFPRMVRDLTKELGKEVDLILEGKDTELDRTVIDEIGDPLVHLIRNALDHGLEPPQERKASQKNPIGMLKLSAKHEGNQVSICVEDDGRGLNVEAIKRKALENKIVTKTQLEIMDEQAIVNLIFESGFSTAKVVTNVSGRGVGLDVVKSKIMALNGQVSVETKKGQGTRFLIKLPLTLAIIQALLVKVQEEIFAIPLANIDETTDLEPEKIKNIQGQPAMVLREKILPLVYIKKILEVPGDKEAEELNVVVVQKGEQKIGLVVEDLIGQQEIVISSLGKLLSGLPGIVGASILGDGTVSLILDLETLF
ncbi:MAG: chemotaxis protein CheA, partial [Clostridia bacterium]|nr:chemotaxis protein CheA [Clostridia bacterium]